MDKLLKDLEAVALLYSVADYENPQKDDWDRFSEALHNLYRTHHAEIAEAVADARRYRFIRDKQATIIYKRKWHGELEPLADTRETSTRCASLDAAIDADIDAQHNSAREG